jgi:hypothetical protein
MVLFGDLNPDDIASKLITFGVDGVNVFQGVKIGVIFQLKNQNAPFMISVATLALGSRPRQGLAKVQAKSEPGSHISCSQECKKV